MRGSIVQRYNNSYSIVLSDTDEKTKKRKQTWITVKGSHRDAERELTRLLRERDLGAFVKPGKASVGEFLERWLKEAYPNLSPKTAENYEHMIKKYLIPELGVIKLTALKSERIQRYYTDQLKHLSPRTVHHHAVLLHGALKNAVKLGLLYFNPADATQPPHFERPEMHTLDEDGLQRFLDAAKGTEYYALFYMALYTGMRRSELLALRWSDVDLLLCQASVSRSLHRLKTGEIKYKQPKTARSRRMVALTPSTCQVLSEHQAQQDAMRLILSATKPDALPQDDSKVEDRKDKLIFSHPDGSPFQPDSVTHAWMKLARKTGLRVRLHDARHTHASLLLKQGVHPAVVQQRLGHASISTTIDTYSHIMPGLQEAAAKGFDVLVSREAQESVR